MSVMGSALLAGLVTFLILITNFACGYAQLIRPIVVGTVMGLALGDVATGAIIGASLEVVYLGIVSVGGTQATDPFMAAAIATPFCIVSGLSQEAAITLAIPIGYLGLILMSIEYMLNTLVMPRIEKFLDEDKETQYCVTVVAIQATTQLMYAAVVVAAVAFGGDVVTRFIASLPEFVIVGIDAVGAMLPAVGLAMLINLMWSGKMAFYFFFGFAVMVYMNLPILFLAILAAFIAFLVITLKPGKKDTTVKTSLVEVAGQSEEEAFFS